MLYERFNKENRNFERIMTLGNKKESHNVNSIINYEDTIFIINYDIVKLLKLETYNSNRNTRFERYITRDVNKRNRKEKRMFYTKVWRVE